MRSAKEEDAEAIFFSFYLTSLCVILPVWCCSSKRKGQILIDSGKKYTKSRNGTDACMMRVFVDYFKV
jgi:hypothetical protein